MLYSRRIPLLPIYIPCLLPPWLHEFFGRCRFVGVDGQIRKICFHQSLDVFCNGTDSPLSRSLLPVSNWRRWNSSSGVILLSRVGITTQESSITLLEEFHDIERRLGVKSESKVIQCLCRTYPNFVDINVYRICSLTPMRLHWRRTSGKTCHVFLEWRRGDLIMLMNGK